MAGLVSGPVPIDWNAIPSNINSYIAKGPDYSWIGNLPDSYFAGQQAGVRERNQNAFPNGLPRDQNGNVDYNAIADTLAKAGGTGSVGPAISTAQFPQLLDAVKNDSSPSVAPAAAPGVQPQGNIPPSTAGGSQPIKTTDQAVPPSQVASANPNGVPQQVQQPTATPRAIAQQTGVDPQMLADAAGVGLDDPVPPERRPAVIAALRSSGSTSQAQPGQQPQQPAQVAQAQPQQQPQGGGEATAQRYEQAAQAAYRKAAAFSLINPNIAKQYQAMGDQYAKAAEQFRGGAIKNQELTPEQKNAATPGPITNFEATKGAAVKGAEDDQVAFDKDYTGISNLGRTAAQLAQRIPIAKNLTLNPNFYSGPMHEGMETYNQFKAIFGTNPSAALPQEAFNKVTNEILADQIKAMGQSGVGRVLQAEVRIMQQGIASLGITPASNRAQLEMLNRVYSEEQQYARIADSVKNNPNIPPGQRQAALNQAITQYQQSHPMFTKDEVQHPEILGAPDAPAASARWSPDQKRAWAQSVGLKPGDPVRMNGNVVAVP